MLFSSERGKKKTTVEFSPTTAQLGHLLDESFSFIGCIVILCFVSHIHFLLWIMSFFSFLIETPPLGLWSTGRTAQTCTREFLKTTQGRRVLQRKYLSKSANPSSGNLCSANVVISDRALLSLQDVTPANFLAVLKGDSSAVKGGSGKVLKRQVRTKREIRHHKYHENWFIKFVFPPSF